MDGVERVMVLGILAVIVAILSFAWSATDESTTPQGALGQGSRGVYAGGGNGSAVPLSNPTHTGPSVVLDEKARNRIAERARINDAAREAQARQRLDMLNEGQAAGRSGRQAPSGPSSAASLADGHTGQSQAPDLPAGSELAQAAGNPRAQRTPTHLRAAGPSVQSPAGGPGASSPEDPGSAGRPFKLYTVVAGDTLWGIAHRAVGAGDTKRMLALIHEFNPGLATSSLSIGRTIKVPVAVQPRLQNRTPIERAEETGATVYIVAPGDTLGAIAAQELGDGSRWLEIYQLNKATIPDPARIRPGQRLLLPGE